MSPVTVCCRSVRTGDVVLIEGVRRMVVDMRAVHTGRNLIFADGGMRLLGLSDALDAYRPEPVQRSSR